MWRDGRVWVGEWRDGNPVKVTQCLPFIELIGSLLNLLLTDRSPFNKPTTIY